MKPIRIIKKYLSKKINMWVVAAHFNDTKAQDIIDYYASEEEADKAYQELLNKPYESKAR